MTTHVGLGDPGSARVEVAPGARHPRAIGFPDRSTVRRRYSPALGRHLAGAAAGAVTFCTIAIALLHLVTADPPLDPMAAPISNYALTPLGWLFDAAVLVLALGLAALLGALVAGRWVSVTSNAFALLTACCAGLVTIVEFPNRATPTGALTPACRIHWAAAMVAFAGIPAVALLLIRKHRSALGCTGFPVSLGRLSLFATGSFTVYFVGSVVEMCTPIRFWPVGGALERALALTDMAIVLGLAVVARHPCRCPAVGMQPADELDDVARLPYRGEL